MQPTAENFLLEGLFLIYRSIRILGTDSVDSLHRCLYPVVLSAVMNVFAGEGWGLRGPLSDDKPTWGMVEIESWMLTHPLPAGSRCRCMWVRAGKGTAGGRVDPSPQACEVVTIFERNHISQTDTRELPASTRKELSDKLKGQDCSENKEAFQDHSTALASLSTLQTRREKEDRRNKRMNMTRREKQRLQDQARKSALEKVHEL